MTYTGVDGIGRQAAGLAAWGGENPAVFSRGPARDRGAAASPATGREVGHATVPAATQPGPTLPYELRIQDAEATWRLVYRVDADAIVIVEVFSKKTRATPQQVMQVCQRRLRAYDQAAHEEE